MIVDGKSIADEILAATKERIANLGHTPIVRAITIAPNAATESYLKIKSARAADAGMTLDVVRLPDTATTEEVLAAIDAGGADAIIVQLPLPASFDTKRILDAIPKEKDADVLSTIARNGALLSPVPAAVKEILLRARVNVAGKQVVVVGQGWLVGDPVATWLAGEGASVTVLTKESGDLSDKLHTTDIVVSGAGVAALIKPEMIKEGVVLIDAGTSESDGALAGDADPACADKAAVFTPVPGGVGPIAVACLFRNVAELLTHTGA